MQSFSITFAPLKGHPSAQSAINEQRLANIALSEECNGYKEAVGKSVACVLCSVGRLEILLDDDTWLQVHAVNNACWVFFQKGSAREETSTPPLDDTVELTIRPEWVVDWQPNRLADTLRGRVFKQISFSPRFVVIYFSGGIMVQLSPATINDTGLPFLYWHVEYAKRRQ